MPKFWRLNLSCVTGYQEILWGCSFGCKNLLNFTWNTIKFYNRCYATQGYPLRAPEIERVKKYGYAMLAPIVLMTIISIRQWMSLEKGFKNLILTFPLVILQVYPQYRALRVLYLGITKSVLWKEEKRKYDRNLNSLGKFLDDESSSLVPVFLLLLLLQKFQLFCHMSIAISLLLSVVYQRVFVKSCEVCF